MAKKTNKRKSKKNNKNLYNNIVFTRILSVLIIFICILGLGKLGIIGNYLNLGVTYIFGYLSYVIYLCLIALSIYSLIKVSIPELLSIYAISIYLYFISIQLFISYIFIDHSIIKFNDLLNYYTNSLMYHSSGFIGTLIYAVFASLIAHTGTLILTIVLFAVASILLFTQLNNDFDLKSSINEWKENRKSEEVEDDDEIEDEDQPSESTSKFFDINAKKKSVIFPEEVFEDETEDIVEEALTNDVSTTEQVESNEPTSLVTNKTYKGKYKLPQPSLLTTKSSSNKKDEETNARTNEKRLSNVLREFGVNANVVNVEIGPTITKYELELETGTRVNKILQLQDDIKLALATADIRIEAPIPGKTYVGIEVPNKKSSVVSFKEVITLLKKEKSLESNKLAVALGMDVSGHPVYCELDKLPHLLVAGATGSGKSVCINTIICSILMRARPDEVRLVLVDPKKVELACYEDLPHLHWPVVKDAKKAALALKEVVKEMDHRYDLFAEAGVRNIAGYNEYVEFHKDDENQPEKMPYMVVILDEVADLMMVASKDVEECIMRIAQLARAAGIHLIIATQRPSTDIITGVIKANIPSRIAFAVSSGIDSRTILDSVGAEKLLGRGDMLYSPIGASSPTRAQGAFLTDDEVSTIVDFCKKQLEPTYDTSLENASSSSSDGEAYDDYDEEYEDCRAFVIQEQKASTSLLQRRFRIGYNKAARIIDQLELDGVIGPQQGSRPREVYIRSENVEDLD